MTGEEDPSDTRSFAAQPKRWRFITLLAGPVANSIAAILILFVAYFAFATRITEGQYRIDSVLPGSPAEQIGILPGDIVVKLNGIDMVQQLSSESQDVTTLPLREEAQASIGKELTIDVQRHDASNALVSVQLRGLLPATSNPDAPLGVALSLMAMKSERVILTPGDALSQAVNDAAFVLTALVRVPIDLIRGVLTLEQVRPTGIVGITNIGVQLFRQNDIQGLFPFIRFAGLISLILGISNLLPIPALDGGRIMFVIVEWIRGKRVDPVREQWVHAIGMVFLLALTAVIVVLDIVKPITLP
jgi:regulator of sigma E protease